MEKAMSEAFGTMTLKMDSIIEEIQVTEEMLKEHYKQYTNGEISTADYEYFKNKTIQDTYDMIKQILEIEGGE